jgi:hypothetical protein
MTKLQLRILSLVILVSMGWTIPSAWEKYGQIVDFVSSQK